MSSYNKSYEMRRTNELEKSGMYYAQDYIDKYFPGKSTLNITAVANITAIPAELVENRNNTSNLSKYFE